MSDFIETYLARNPAFAVMQGRHEYDGQLPDWSPTGLQKSIAALEAASRRAGAFSDQTLSSEQRFQRAYLQSRIAGDLFWLRDARQPFTNPAFYFDNGLDPSTYLTVPYAAPAQRLRAFVRYAAAIPVVAQQIRQNLAEAPLPNTFVVYASEGFRGYASFFQNEVKAAFAEVQDAALQAQLSAALVPAAQAMTELAQWFEQRPKQTGQDRAYVLGRARFRAMLHETEAVDTPLEQLERLGQADLERNLSALQSACSAYAPQLSLSACVEKEAADKPRGGAVEGARNQLAQLREYLIAHAIVSIPGEEQARVEESPPYNRANAAYINIPGPYEKNLPSIYYIAPPNPAWSKAEQDAYVPGQADLLFTSVHEVWPGHFLQFLHSNRAAWRFGQLFVGYAFAEGWAHYSEELMVEEGLAEGQPELQVGQVLNALLRNVRFLCSIGLHTEDMSPEQCERMFKDKAYQDPGNARQQAARGTYDPAYLNYTLGKLMIRKLRADWLAENPGHALREFHDRFLSFGGPPIPLLRERMLKHSEGDLF